MQKTGSANLPLHYGNVPRWLSERMKEMGKAIVLAIIEIYGRDEFLRRISDPFWFQSLGAVMGMDWHSSGITTSVLGALKSGLNPLSKETGLYICGGRGAHSRKTPDEIADFAFKTGISGDELIRCSRLSAKIDNTCIHDGYSLYLHNFILTADGKWAVIQQGMNQNNRMARRYHWLSEGLKSFLDDPHNAVIGKNEGNIINLADSRAKPSRDSIIDFLSISPDKQIAEINCIISNHTLNMPAHHEVKVTNINTKRLGAVLAVAYHKGFKDFTDAILIEGVGPRTIQALCLVAEIIYGQQTRFSDPARFSFAHGGKDGHPFPVPLKTYDESIAILKKAVQKAKLGNREQLEALRKLDRLTRAVEEKCSPEINFERLIKHEKEISPSLDGRTVFDKK